MSWLKEKLRNSLFQEESEKLEKYRLLIDSYQKWFSSFDDVYDVLEAIKHDISAFPLNQSNEKDLRLDLQKREIKTHLETLSLNPNDIVVFTADVSNLAPPVASEHLTEIADFMKTQTVNQCIVLPKGQHISKFDLNNDTTVVFKLQPLNLHRQKLDEYKKAIFASLKKTYPNHNVIILEHDQEVFTMRA